MSYLKVNDLNIYYEKKGSSGKPMILLHGWGQNTTMMDLIAEGMKEHFQVYNIDFPGFGKSSIPKEALSVEDYAKIIHSFNEQLNIDNPIIIAHSFGCRVAFHYARKYPVNKMVLTGAAGIKDERDWNYYLKTYAYKFAKKVMSLPFLKKYAEKYKNSHGSADYKAAQGIMRPILVKAVNDDVKPFLKDIKCETLLVFGRNDDAVPIAKGEMMEKLMPDATLVVFENDDHYAYYHQAERFNRVLDAFLRSQYEI